MVKIKQSTFTWYLHDKLSIKTYK